MRFPIISFLFLVMAITGFVVFSFDHEQAHVQIYRSDGIESRIEYFKPFPKVVTIPEEPCRTEVCRLSNNFNEVVGYSLITFLAIIILGFYFIILILEVVLLN